MHTWFKKFGPTLLVVAAIVAIPLATAHAQSLLGFPGLSYFVEFIVSIVVDLAIKGTSFLVVIAGALLNFSMSLTLNIKSFVDSTPAIYTTWRTIRDISGMFLIFFLLYAAFQLILGTKRPNFNELIRNVVLAGILINFSFFITGLGIDVSNIVSVQLYNAIAPANSLNAGAATTNIMDGTWRSKFDGGLADLFMNHLKVQAIYQTKFAPTGDASTMGQAVGNGVSNALSMTVASAPVKIFIMGIVAVLVEFTAAMSFGAAALAFIFRFVVLLLLLAFSPVMLLGFLPEVGSYTKKWIDHYWAMLIFMPVYLLLMYVALSVLTTSNLFGGDGPAAIVGDTWYAGLLSLGVNAVIVIFLLNMPLAAAASIAGSVIGLLNKAQKSFGAGRVWSAVGGFAGTHTIGAAAARANTALEKTNIPILKSFVGNSVLGKQIRDATVGELAKSKMGGLTSHEERVKLQKEVGKREHELERNRTLNRVLNERIDNKPHQKDAEGKDINVSKVMSSMNGKERVGAITAVLKDEKRAKELLKYARDDDFDSIKKSEDIRDEDKATINKLRREALTEAVSAEKYDPDAIKNMVDNMSGKDLMKLGDLLTKESVIANLKPSQLKALADEGLDSDTKKRIANRILYPGTAHKARGFLNKKENRVEWLGEDDGGQNPQPQPDKPKEKGPTLYDGNGRPIT